MLNLKENGNPRDYPRILTADLLSKPDKRNSDPLTTDDNFEAFKVFVRVRPCNSNEISKTGNRANPKIIKVQDNMIFVLDPEKTSEFSLKTSKTYVFDKVFTESDDNALVYSSMMSPVLSNLFNGYNSTLFAYGMTGAGKTHTLFGELENTQSANAEQGLIKLALLDLFKHIDAQKTHSHQYQIKFSYLEIYNEQVRDLLKPGGGSNPSGNLMIIEDPSRGVFVTDLSEYNIESSDEAIELINLGNQRRTMASTAANQFSSRSHAIIQAIVEQRETKVGFVQSIFQSKLCMIDLAGSERAATTENKGIRMLEGANINRSLLSLGNCINILSDATKKGAFVPYRDSKLTRLLKDSLGGNTKTVMITCVSPSALHYEETVNSLKYANRAKNIKKKVQANVTEVELHISQYKEIISNLRNEIDNLKLELREQKSGHLDTQASVIIKDPDQKKQVSGSETKGSKEEKKIEQMSIKIFENLEQNWELNQALRELDELRMQNMQQIETLQDKLQQLKGVEKSQSDSEYQDIEKQIFEFEKTMQSNEEIKEEILENLKQNVLKNEELTEELGVYTRQPNEIEFAKKLMEIEKLDINAQNREIKKEALALAKEKIARNKQIEMMEEEIKSMKLQLEQKDRLLASNNTLINNLKQHQSRTGSKTDRHSPNKYSGNFPDSIRFPEETLVQKLYRQNPDFVRTYDNSSSSPQKIKSSAQLSKKPKALELSSKTIKRKTYNQIHKNETSTKKKLREMPSVEIQVVTNIISPRSQSAYPNSAGIAYGSHQKHREKEASGSYSARYSKDHQLGSATGSNYRKATAVLATKNEPRDTPVDISSLSFERAAKSEKSFAMIPSQIHEISEIFKENNNELNESVSVQDFLHELHPFNAPLTSRYISNQEYQNIQSALQRAQTANYAAAHRRLQNKNTRPVQLQQNYQSPIPVIPERSDSMTSLNPSVNQLSTPRTPLPILRTGMNSVDRHSSQFTQDSANSKIHESNQSRNQSHNDSYSNPSNTPFGNVTERREYANRSLTPDTHLLQQNNGLLSTSHANNSSSEPLKQDRSVTTIDSRKASFIEIRSLESAREDLKQFRHKLNLISGLELGNKKLSEPLKKEILSLLEEWQKHNFTISSIELENLKRLEFVLIKNGIKRNDIQIEKQEKSFTEKRSPNTSYSMKVGRIGDQPQILANSVKGDSNRESKPEISSSSTSITQPSEVIKSDKIQPSSKPSSGLNTIIGNLGGAVLVRGCFSNISSNYAKTLSKTLNTTGAPKIKQSENTKSNKPIGNNQASSRERTQKDDDEHVEDF